MPIDPITFSSPSITHAEIEYAAAATALGWNFKRTKHTNIFQKQMAAFTGQKYAFATVNVTAALHLALAALGTSVGDEVLVPELADISVAASVLYTGAKPVFCDVDPLTLCLSPSSVESNITPRTKGIIPVHMHGMPCDMLALRTIAAEHKLFIVEESTQGLGSKCQGRAAGSLGHFSVFGFNELQAVVTGDGGMLLSSNQQLFSKAFQLGQQGKSPKNPFIYESLGYNYAMSNVQGAIGAAQMERVQELLAKKKNIYS